MALEVEGSPSEPGHDAELIFRLLYSTEPAQLSLAHCQ